MRRTRVVVCVCARQGKAWEGESATENRFRTDRLGENHCWSARDPKVLVRPAGTNTPGFFQSTPTPHRSLHPGQVGFVRRGTRRKSWFCGELVGAGAVRDGGRRFFGLEKHSAATEIVARRERRWPMQKKPARRDDQWIYFSRRKTAAREGLGVELTSRGKTISLPSLKIFRLRPYHTAKHESKIAATNSEFF